jgi:putative ABC transport system substrate-binding protein
MISVEESAFKTLEAAARSLGVQVHMLDVRGADDLAAAIGSATRWRADALMVVTTPMLHVHQRRIVDLTVKHRLPAIAQFSDFPSMGGLMAYGPNLPALFRCAAAYVDRILKGSNPTQMPVEQPVPELTLNLKAAKALGLTIPPSLLARADQVINECAVSELCQNHRVLLGGIRNGLRAGPVQRAEMLPNAVR